MNEKEKKGLLKAQPTHVTVILFFLPHPSQCLTILPTHAKHARDYFSVMTALKSEFRSAPYL